MTDCSLKTILKEKMTPLRQKGAWAFFNKKITDQFYRETVDEIRQTAKTSFPELDETLLKKQLALAHQAYLQGAVKDKIELASPILQYVWAVTLMRIAANPYIMDSWAKENQSANGLINSRIWEQIKNTDMMQQELQDVTVMLASRGFVYDTMKIRWGGTKYPGVGYYFSPDKNLVNMDMVWGMFMGLEHARSVVFHELAHSCGTRIKTPLAQQMFERINELEKRGKKKKLTPEETKELHRLSVLHQLHFYVYDEAENSFADGFGCLLTDEKLYHQDLRYDRCAVEAQSLSIAGQLYENEAASKTLAKKINQGFDSMNQNEKNDIAEFSNMKKVLRLAFYVNNGLFQNTQEEWQNIGVHVDWLKGYARDGKVIFGQEVLNEFVTLSAQLQSYQIPLDIHSARPYIVQKIEASARARNEITDDIYNRFFKEISEKLCQQLSQSREEEIIVTEIRENQAQNNQSKDDASSGKEQNADGQGQNIEEQEQNAQREKQNTEEQNQNTENSNKTQNGEQSARSHQNADQRKTNDTDQGKEVQNIIEQAAQNASRKNAAQPEKDTGNWKPSFADDFKMPIYKKDINTYNEIIDKYPMELKKLKELFNQLKSLYYDDKHQRRGELIPQGSLNDTLNIQSVQNLLIKQQTGQQLNIDHFKHYDNPVAPTLKKAPIDICVFVDVSGSVAMNGVSKLAIEIGCLLNEAVRKNDSFNVYLGLMTNPVYFLAEPGWDDKEIAGRLGAIYHQNNLWGVGDEIYDATLTSLQKIISRHSPQEKEGAVHFFYITDGGHNDEELAHPALNALMNHSPFTTFNWIELPGWDKSDTLLNNLKKERGDYKGAKGIVSVMCQKSEHILPALEKLLKERIIDMKRIPSVTAQWKKQSLTAALEKAKQR